MQREIKMKQTRRFVDSITLKNNHCQFEQQTISNCVIIKMVVRPICPLLGANFVVKQQIGPSLAPFYSKYLYKHMVLLLDVENTT